jgi:hypothetical protein
MRFEAMDVLDASADLLLFARVLALAMAFSFVSRARGGLLRLGKNRALHISNTVLLLPLNYAA